MLRIFMWIAARGFSITFKTPLKEFPLFAIASHFGGFQQLDRAFAELDRQEIDRNWANTRSFLDETTIRKTEAAASEYTRIGKWPGKEDSQPEAQ